MSEPGRRPKWANGGELMQFDILIVDGGPVGLSFTVTPAQHGHSVAALEQSPVKTLRTPSFLMVVRLL